MRLTVGLALALIALDGCSSSSFEIGAGNDAATEPDSQAALDTGPVVEDEVGVVDARPATDTCSTNTTFNFSVLTSPVIVVSRARAVALSFAPSSAGSVSAITVVMSRQPYDCPEDTLGGTCKSIDPICSTCTVDMEGSCTCSTIMNAVGNVVAKLFKGTPGAGNLLATASSLPSAITESPGLTATRFEFTGAPTLAAGTNMYVELTTDSEAFEFMLRGGDGAPPSLGMSLRQTFYSFGWQAYPAGGRRPALSVVLTECD